MANYILGKDCKSYYDATPLTSTSYATPLAASTEITNIKDVKANTSKDTADVSTRATGGWKATATTLTDASITFTMVWIPADAGFTALQTAYQTNAEIAFYCLDGVKTADSGSQGLAGNWHVKSFARSEPLAEAVTVDVELVPSSFNGWVTA